jgi:hypothetical protein
MGLLIFRIGSLIIGGCLGMLVFKWERNRDNRII